MENTSQRETSNSDTCEHQVNKNDAFKKPIIIEKAKRVPNKVSRQNNSDPENETRTSTPEASKEHANDVHKDNFEDKDKTPETSAAIPYKEPIWSGLPQSLSKNYDFEVLKNGSIIEVINLMDKSFWVIGRLTTCHISMQHPTISRYHAVLQYRAQKSEMEEPGFYVYDLGSTHGTFLNKNRLKPRIYVRIQVGHMLKFGCSTRSFILNGPDYDEEQESELTVTELKQKRAEEILKLEEAAREAERKEEERGIDWGLGEDADEETDLSENPYANTNNEELYLDDPKKALRGFFEREGLDLEYDCTEQGIGQFLCKVELPLDDDLGRPIIAEVLHKGKKKEAVIQCALEACRILDKYGVLRQATHESRKRKARNWEENDYYDSDEDIFFDRTGTIEKKREKRMNAKQPQKAETYENLLEREKVALQSIADLENQLANVQAENEKQNVQNSDEDSLDTFMKGLTDSKCNKESITKIKSELAKLKTEHSKIVRMLDIARPVNLPPLLKHDSAPSTSKDIKRNEFPIIGKRKKIKVEIPKPSTVSKPVSASHSENESEEEDDDEEEEKEPKKDKEKGKQNSSDSASDENINDESAPDHNEESMESSNYEDFASQPSNSEEDNRGFLEFPSIKSLHGTMSFRKFEKLMKKGLPPFADKHQDKLQKILNNLKKLAASEDRMHVDWKMLTAKKRKLLKLIADLKTCESNEKLEHKVSSELNRILQELNSMTEQKYTVIDKVKKIGVEIKSISETIDKDFQEYKAGINSSKNEPSCSDPTSEDPVAESLEDNEKNEEKKKKKNQRRILQRQEKAEIERQRAYEEDANREGYNMWVPPNNQTGDGRTSLNDKFGY